VNSHTQEYRVALRSKQFYKNHTLTFVRHGSKHCAKIPRLASSIWRGLSLRMHWIKTTGSRNPKQLDQESVALILTCNKSSCTVTCLTLDRFRSRTRTSKTTRKWRKNSVAYPYMGTTRHFQFFTSSLTSASSI
jgi:hypothetical protein